MVPQAIDAVHQSTFAMIRDVGEMGFPISSFPQLSHQSDKLDWTMGFNDNGVLDSRPSFAISPTIIEETTDDILDKLEQAGRVPSKEKFRRMACNTFIYTGACPYNDRCVFLHDYRIKTEGAKVRTTRQTKINSTIKDTFYWPDMVRKDVVKHLDAQGLPTANQMYIIPEPFKMNPHNFHNRGLYSLWAHFVEFCIHNNVLAAKRFADLHTEPFFEMSNYRENPHVPNAKRLPIFIHLSMTKPERRSKPYGWTVGHSEPIMPGKDAARTFYSVGPKEMVSSLPSSSAPDVGRYHSPNNDNFAIDTGWAELSYSQGASRPHNTTHHFSNTAPSSSKGYNWQLEDYEGTVLADGEHWPVSGPKSLMEFDDRGHYLGGMDNAHQFGVLESPQKSILTDESHVKTFDEEEDLETSMWIRSADTLSLWGSLRHETKPIFRNFSDQPINHKLDHGESNSGVIPSPQTIPTLRWSS